MLVIAPDFDRTIELDGVGPTPRPVSIDQAATGFADLVSLRVYDFVPGPPIVGEAEGDEVIVALLAGAVTIEVTGVHEGAFTLDADGDWAVTLPPRHRYRLDPLTPATVAYARARPDASGPPRALRPVSGVLAVECDRLRLRLLPLQGDTDLSAGLDGGLERIALVTGPATLSDGTALPPMTAVALAPGEGARVEGEGDLLVAGALRP